MIVDTQHNDVGDCVAQIVSYIEKTIKVDIAKESKKQDKALCLINCWKTPKHLQYRAPSCCKSGDVTLSYFDMCGYEGADQKDDGSPVTAADQAAEKVILEG